jgi:hypothetical protein
MCYFFCVFKGGLLLVVVEGGRKEGEKERSIFWFMRG